MINVRNDRYTIICSIYVHQKQHPPSIDGSSSGGGNSIPQNSTTEALASLGATFDFIDCWLKCFDINYQDRSNMYIEDMQDFFKKIPGKLPKPLSHKEKRK